jgi:hypothetical protein
MCYWRITNTLRINGWIAARLCRFARKEFHPNGIPRRREGFHPLNPNLDKRNQTSFLK